MQNTIETALGKGYVYRTYCKAIYRNIIKNKAISK
jgi:hypothetical protein